MKTRRYYHKQEQRKAKGISARVRAICEREVSHRCKTFYHDPMEQLARTGRIRGHKVC